MKFFTPDWSSGNLSQRESDAVPARYAVHVESLLPALPATIRALVQGVNMHDGLIRRVAVDQANQTLELQFRCGDLQVGYFDLGLVYSRVRMQCLDLAALETIAEDPKSEVLYDEIDTGTTGLWVHRILFSTDREFAVEFGALGLHLEPQSDREFQRPRKVYSELKNKAD